MACPYYLRTVTEVCVRAPSHSELVFFDIRPVWCLVGVSPAGVLFHQPSFEDSPARMNSAKRKTWKISLPFYMHPDRLGHKNPELADIFSAAIPQVAETLAAFDSNHRVVANSLNFFRSRKKIERAKKAGDGMASLGLVLTPELEVVLDAAMAVLLCHKKLGRSRGGMRDACYGSGLCFIADTE
ncbi:hypothetical protein K438DRAFT_1789399 [Mycena galopus ATCC 62051]|nr:hypothetical protein K438DRAFT_1789399 [Mycena galopus ATCC 62051]